MNSNPTYLSTTEDVLKAKKEQQHNEMDALIKEIFHLNMLAEDKGYIDPLLALKLDVKYTSKVIKVMEEHLNELINQTMAKA